MGNNFERKAELESEFQKLNDRIKRDTADLATATAIEKDLATSVADNGNTDNGARAKWNAARKEVRELGRVLEILAERRERVTVALVDVNEKIAKAERLARFEAITAQADALSRRHRALADARKFESANAEARADAMRTESREVSKKLGDLEAENAALAAEFGETHDRAKFTVHPDFDEAGARQALADYGVSDSWRRVAAHNLEYFSEHNRL